MGMQRIEREAQRRRRENCSPYTCTHARFRERGRGVGSKGEQWRARFSGGEEHVREREE